MREKTPNRFDITDDLCEDEVNEAENKSLVTRKSADVKI